MVVRRRRGPASLVAAAVLGCAAPATQAPPAPAPSAAPARWVDSTLTRMPLRDKAAQLVWPWILGDYVPEHSAEWARIESLVTAQHVGGFIVSVGGPLDIAAKLNALQHRSDVPLLVSADLETGAGFRARGGYFVPNAIELGGATTFPLQMALGAAADTSLAAAEGRITAVEGRAIGIHIAFGPVLDVNNNPANPVIGARSFSEDPALTARLGAAFVRSLQANGMLATGKHFPGHGDTETNSHLALAEVTASRARLDSVELVPFKAGIAAGMGAIMTFHGFLPALDSSGVPATLSSRVMTDLLRHELKFDGLLVTDAMDMRGVTDRYGAAEAVKRALAAGADVLLMPADVGGAIDAVVRGVAEGRYTEARIDSSVRRLLALKQRFGLDRRREVELTDVRRIVGDTVHTMVARRIAERGLVLVKDSLRSVPLPDRANLRVLSISYAVRAELGAGVTFDAELRRGGRVVRSAFVSADDAAPNFDPLLAAADSADVVVVSSYANITSATATTSAPRAFIEFVRMLQMRGAKPVIVAFGNPYLLQQIASVPTYLVAWGPSTASQSAAARALLGQIGISGRLPISIPPVAVLGAGEQRNARETSRANPRDG